MEANINPVVLKWAREERIKISVEYAAKKLRVRPERLKSWKDNTDKPAFNQFKLIARLYRPHLSYFYLPETSPTIPTPAGSPLRCLTSLPYKITFCESISTICVIYFRNQ